MDWFLNLFGARFLKKIHINGCIPTNDLLTPSLGVEIHWKETEQISLEPYDNTASVMFCVKSPSDPVYS